MTLPKDPIKKEKYIKNHILKYAFKKGDIPHNKGKTKENYEPLRRAGETESKTKKRLIKEGKLKLPKGKNHLSYGKHTSIATEFKKGHKSLKKGKTFEEIYGKERAKEIIKKRTKNTDYNKISERMKENNPAKYCRNPSKPQLFMFNQLKKVFTFTPIYLNYKVAKDNGGNYYLDVAIPQLKLNFEYDCKYWHSINGAKEKDQIRDNFLMREGWGVIRVNEVIK